jgi:hypothetical protein
MRAKLLLITCSLVFSTSVFSGAKSDFISAVKTQCNETENNAKKMATPGRSGNVMKYKTCTSDSITIDKCTLSCKDASSSIGGL